MKIAAWFRQSKDDLLNFAVNWIRKTEIDFNFYKDNTWLMNLSQLECAILFQIQKSDYCRSIFRGHLFQWKTWSQSFFHNTEQGTILASTPVGDTLKKKKILKFTLSGQVQYDECAGTI